MNRAAGEVAVQIPLDYYRILGLPLAASEEQLRQAYSDRIVQLPRREYSQAAIGARKLIIEKAYVILSDPRERKVYEQACLSHTYEPENSVKSASVVVEGRQSPHNIKSDTQNLGIEIPQEEVVGALLILQELGEYELVLKLGHPYLVNHKVSANSKEVWDFPAEFPDIVLTVALACLELGREQWQQGNYENAAISLETGEELLVKEKLFSSLQAEIKSDLYKLRPYRILELLQLPIEKTSERNQGLQLLQTILRERGGIDGAEDDSSGLNIDDFLRFIQQLRHYLTVAEQHKLFEVESKRPSAVATYLTIYSLLARGFTQRKPALIRQAKQMLLGLGARQDIHLEQSLCSLLLGQTEEASRVLELSQEYEALAFIREKSQDSPDLLSGLCLYTEHWLETEVFPHFRDLVNQPASLKEYFADSQVQSYLEALPIEEQKSGYSHEANHHSGNLNPYHKPSRENDNYQRSPDIREASEKHQPVSHNIHFSPPPPTNQNHSLTNNQQLGIGIEDNNNYSNPTRRKGKTSIDARHTGIRKRRRTSRPRNSLVRLLLVMLTSVAGVILLWVLLSTAFSWFRNLFNPVPSLQGKQVAVVINQPLMEIPQAGSQPKSPEGKLTEIAAINVIGTWLSTKSVALGPNHDTISLENVLVGSALSQWRIIARRDKNSDRYRQFQHQIRDVKIEQNASDENQVAVEASVNEIAHIYERGQKNEQKSYNDNLRVKYDLIRQDGKWLIQSMSLVASEIS